MNIHFSELLVILIVMLLVIKPDQLPAIALKLGRWTTKLRHFLVKMKLEIDSHD